MTETARPADLLRPLRRVRQVRDYTAEPVAEEALRAVADVARWTGSSRNGQPWRFIAIRETASLRAIAELGHPQTRALATATAAIAIVLPEEPSRAVVDAYDEGRAAERILIAAEGLGLGAAICWVVAEARPAVAAHLDLPAGRYVRTVVALGHPTDAARQPRAKPGEARLPREETVFEERWPG